MARKNVKFVEHPLLAYSKMWGHLAEEAGKEGKLSKDEIVEIVRVGELLAFHLDRLMKIIDEHGERHPKTVYRGGPGRKVPDISAVTDLWGLVQRAVRLGGCAVENPVTIARKRGQTKPALKALAAKSSKADEVIWRLAQARSATSPVPAKRASAIAG